MKTIIGQYSSATIHTDIIEDYAIAQIKAICDNPVLADANVQIMPDVHPGKVSPIGLTMKIRDAILPSLIGIDIGCGMTIAKIKQKHIEFQRMDTVIREKIPSGFAINQKPHRFHKKFQYSELECHSHINQMKASLSICSLGGGNHFIEIEQDDDGALYILIHTGSRHLGKEVTDYYMNMGERDLKQAGEDIPYELTYLTGHLMNDYIHDVQVIQAFAELNRQAILDEVVRGMKLKVTDSFSTIHNYIEPYGNQYMLRKGAISAKQGERMIVPINMKDGALLCTGKGNIDWNESAPHGSGRIMNRENVKSRFTVSQFKSEMKGIYSNNISALTLDEAPFAYRKLQHITDYIGETAEINELLHPIYNFKAGSN